MTTKTFYKHKKELDTKKTLQTFMFAVVLLVFFPQAILAANDPYHNKHKIMKTIQQETSLTKRCSQKIQSWLVELSEQRSKKKQLK